MASHGAGEASPLLLATANTQDEPTLEAGVVKTKVSGGARVNAPLPQAELNFCGYEECSPACVWAEVS